MFDALIIFQEHMVDVEHAPFPSQDTEQKPKILDLRQLMEENIGAKLEKRLT